MKDKIKNFVKDNYLFIIEFLFFIVFNLFTCYNLKKEGVNTFSSMFCISCLIAFIVELFFLIFTLKLDKMKIHKVYLYNILIIGFLYLLLFPFNAFPDNAAHTLRSYEVSQGNLLSKKYKNGIVGRKLDNNIVDAISTEKGNGYSNEFKALKIKSSNNKQKQTFANTALYSFVCYIPQAIGLTISKIFFKNILIQIFIGRIFNFLAFAFLMYFSIKYIPIKKELLFLISFLPITLQAAVSLSPDALTIAVACALISYVLYLKEKPSEPITNKQLVLLSLLGITLSQCKIVYLPICLILFLIPKEKFGSLKRKNIIIFAMLFIMFILNIIWLKLVSGYLPSNPGSKTNSALQLKYVINNPFNFFNAMFLTIDSQFLYWTLGAFGKNLGCFNINVSDIIVFSNILIFIIISITNYKEKITIRKIEKWLYIFMIISVVCLIMGSLYIQWSPVGSRDISGIQGRYFIPILLLISLILSNNKNTSKINFSKKFFYLFMLLENVYVLSCIFWTFV